jgi:hypothetical protein
MGFANLLILEAMTTFPTSDITISAQDTAGRVKCPGSLAPEGLELLQERRKKLKVLKKILKVERDGL